MAVTPAPLMAALTAPVAGLISDRYGQRVVAVPGALLFAAGCLFLAGSMDATPDYARELLPGQLLTGSGVGLSFAAWGSAAVAGLPPARFATGSAVLACLRQVGAVLGIAVLVALLDGASPADPAAAFHEALAADGRDGSRHGRDRPRARARAGAQCRRAGRTSSGRAGV